MRYFTEVTDGHVITVSGGVYRQASLFERGGRAYARYGAGFVRLHQGSTTSHTGVKWVEIDPGESKISEKAGAVYCERT